MSSFPDSFVEMNPESSTHPFEEEEKNGYIPPPYSDFSDRDSVKESVTVSADFNNNYAENGDPTAEGVFVESDGPILPPPDEMVEEGFALREWRRQNAMVLEQKEKREKEILSQIIKEANEYKVTFHEKRKVTCENNKTNNHEKEKLFLTNQEKFHSEVDKNYWKAIAELIPNEVPAIEKRGKKDLQKKPSVVVVQGPKPGKPADLARMRQILVKLKHNTPAHLKLSPPPAVSPSKDAKIGDAVATSSKPSAPPPTPEAVVAA